MMLASISPYLDGLGNLKTAVTVLLLTLFWGWETWFPFFGQTTGRVRHAARNLTVAIGNTIVIGLLCSGAVVLTATWTALHQVGLLHLLALDEPWLLLVSMVLLDAWMYLWHRANHAIPLLWRFHRMHHSDDRMDVTTAVRFHLGEHLGSSALRLALIPLLGLEVEQLLLYDVLVVAATLFHHANITIGSADRWLRCVVVTPFMHKVHHSRLGAETDSNFAVVLSLWDRLGRSFRLRHDLEAIEFGLDEFAGQRWHTISGMLMTPFRRKPDTPS